jgi:hypothetical protein
MLAIPTKKETDRMIRCRWFYISNVGIIKQLRDDLAAVISGFDRPIRHAIPWDKISIVTKTPKLYLGQISVRS